MGSGVLEVTTTTLPFVESGFNSDAGKGRHGPVSKAKWGRGVKLLRIPLKGSGPLNSTFGRARNKVASL